MRLTLKDEDGDRLTIRFAVHDTGIGIPKQQLQSVFEAFSQVDDSNTRNQGGTGLGLAISKQLVEMMDGHVGVTSEVGRGSVFWCDLPLKLLEPAKA